MQSQKMFCTKEGKQFKCQVDCCDKSFTSWQGWQYHFLNKHTKIRNPCTANESDQDVFPAEALQSNVNSDCGDISSKENTPERDVSLGKRSSSESWDIIERSPKNQKNGCSSRPVCDICGKKLSSFSNLKVHRNTLHFGQRWRCKICGRTCTSKESVLKTCRKAHCGEDVEFVRPEDSEEGTSPLSTPLSSPMIIPNDVVLGDEAEQLEALECIQSIVSLSRAVEIALNEESLEKEKEKEKESEPETDYGEEYSDSSDHWGGEEEASSSYRASNKPTCHICGKEFASNSSLKVHKNILHFGKRWKCRICGRICTKKQNVQATCRRHHSGEDIEVISAENDVMDAPMLMLMDSEPMISESPIPFIKVENIQKISPKA